MKIKAKELLLNVFLFVLNIAIGLAILYSIYYTFFEMELSTVKMIDKRNIINIDIHLYRILSIIAFFVYFLIQDLESTWIGRSIRKIFEIFEEEVEISEEFEELYRKFIER